MNQIEKYKAIGEWVDIFHKRNFYSTGLVKDFKHDIWLKLVNRNDINLAYIKETCKYYPRYAIQHVYYKRTSRGEGKVPREVVLLNEEGGYVDFPDYPFEVELTYPKIKSIKRNGKNHLTNEEVLQIRDRLRLNQFTTKAALAKEFSITYNCLCGIQSGRSYKNLRRLRVHYLNKQSEVFESTEVLSKVLGLSIDGLRGRIGRPLEGRFTNRKLSHIRLIEWEREESKPLSN
jgi:hypothetical protein